MIAGDEAQADLMFGSCVMVRRAGSSCHQFYCFCLPPACSAVLSTLGFLFPLGGAVENYTKTGPGGMLTGYIRFV